MKTYKVVIDFKYSIAMQSVQFQWCKRHELLHLWVLDYRYKHSSEFFDYDEKHYSCVVLNAKFKRLGMSDVVAFQISLVLFCMQILIDSKSTADHQIRIRLLLRAPTLWPAILIHSPMYFVWCVCLAAMLEWHCSAKKYCLTAKFVCEVYAFVKLKCNSSSI